MVRCAACGFLALRNLEDRSLSEAEYSFREKGSVATGGTGQRLYHDMPICFEMAADLTKEADSLQLSLKLPWRRPRSFRLSRKSALVTVLEYGVRVSLPRSIARCL